MFTDDDEGICGGDRTLCLFSRTNPFRKLCMDVTNSQNFDNFILLCIVTADAAALGGCIYSES